MLINGRPRQGCTALIEDYIQKTGSRTITVAPLTKFPLIRDLVVDRASMFANLQKVHAWIDAEDSFDRGEGPRIAPALQDVMYTLSTCMTCGCCTESCPQVNPKSKFMGPAPISQVRLFNAHPIGKLQKDKRLQPMLEEGGISDCGNSQNCVQVCPKEIPLTESLGVIGGEAGSKALRDFFRTPDKQ